jgi:plastocyanin
VRRRLVAGALGLGLLAGPGAPPVPGWAVSGWAPSGSAVPGGRAAPATVADPIVGFTFVVGWASLNAPEQMLRIRPGDTVEWTNLDPISHSVAFDAMPQALYLKQPGDKGSITFTAPGYYTYRCAEHPEFPGMYGLVFVSD